MPRHVHTQIIKFHFIMRAWKQFRRLTMLTIRMLTVQWFCLKCRIRQNRRSDFSDWLAVWTSFWGNLPTGIVSRHLKFKNTKNKIRPARWWFDWAEIEQRSSRNRTEIEQSAKLWPLALIDYVNGFDFECKTPEIYAKEHRKLFTVRGVRGFLIRLLFER